MNPHLAHIWIFPIKSLDGQRVPEAPVLAGGGLAHDRVYCLLDDKGDVLNGKRLGEAIVGIRSEFHFGFGEVTLRHGTESVTGHLGRGKEHLEKWLGQRLQQTVRLAQNTTGGFPDDTDYPGPTLISTATLREAAAWFGIELEEARRRFRANLEIDGVEAFWEDRLYGPAGEGVRFRIGEVQIDGMNPCARCAVPSRDSRTGAISDPKFQKIFAERRRKTIPPWADRSRFDHFYRLAVNTRIPAPEAGKRLHERDEVML